MNLSLLNKKIIVAIVLAGLLPIGFASTSVIIAQAKASQTVRLSNGKSIVLGDTLAKVKTNLANNISESRPGIYRYPADTKLPVQINIYTDQGKVVAMLVGRNANHFQVLDKLHLGMTGTALSQLFGGRLQAINTKTDFVKQRGYKVGGMGVVSYYMTQTCTHLNGDNVEYLAVVKPGAEKILKFLSHPLTCNTAVPTTKPASIPAVTTTTNTKK